jgi:hypothetical protein
MTKRENIILAASAAALVVGVVYLIMEWGPGTAQSHRAQDLKTSKEFAGMTDEGLRKASPTTVQDRILELAAVDWAGDPFLGKRLVAAQRDSEPDKAAKLPALLAYTGFIIAGQMRLAVINGMEYQVGEVVLGSELVVQAIDPQNVVVKPLGGRESFNVPFSGEVLR